jgi:hypothetical protein
MTADVLKPRWTSSSFLLYLGAFTVWGSATAAYAYLSDQYGQGAFVAWTLLFLAVFAALAVALQRPVTWLAAGLFAYLAVSAFGVTVGSAFDWWGLGGADTSDNPFDGWHWAIWLALLLVLAAAVWALLHYRFPLFVFTIALVPWFVVTDFVSGGGSWSAVVTLFFGLVYFAIGLAVNRVFGFWVQVVAGLLVGGALLYWLADSEAGWWVLAVFALLFILIGMAVQRSSWTVLGSLGLLGAATYFSVKWTVGEFAFFEGPQKVWIPMIVFAVTGFILVVLGLLGIRRGDTPTVVVE